MDSVIYLKGSKQAPSCLSQTEFIASLDDLRLRLKNPYQINNGSAEEDKDKESKENADEEGEQVITEELIEAGKVAWSDYKDFFDYAFGGLWGIAMIVFIHLVINLCTLGVSLFLAFSLTQKFSNDEKLSPQEEQSEDMKYNVVLVSIITFALFSSFVGKFLSNKIFMGINRRLHDHFSRSMINTGIQFYEMNTQGRILNRFSKDVSVMDNLVFTVLEMTDVSKI